MVTRHEDPVFAALNAVDAAVDTLLSAEVSSRSTREQVQLLRRLEIIASRLPAVGHRLLSALRETATPPSWVTRWPPRSPTPCTSPPTSHPPRGENPGR
ncbi:hypothetical protein [Mycolicibacterium komossense]|uniref:DUF222 domain-containing protein n=1 Tax=Mycolicibacterium komossense TaxID=1779 RepID=A0ABT3CEN9_9MYCO|nr:hypothetical protein [Mycolicibacterium komossense]MCV7227861.1 hypothetical protein [Mycolicibacterium komossense]